MQHPARTAGRMKEGSGPLEGIVLQDDAELTLKERRHVVRVRLHYRIERDTSLGRIDRPEAPPGEQLARMGFCRDWRHIAHEFPRSAGKHVHMHERPTDAEMSPRETGDLDLVSRAIDIDEAALSVERRLYLSIATAV